MPVNPYNWMMGDFFSASRLMNELYMTAGLPFAANGTRWHAMKPVYKSYLYGSQSLTSVQWNQMGTRSFQSYGVVGDTAALLGTAMDPNLNGSVKLVTPNSGGGTPGGLGLLSAFPALESGVGNNAAGIGPTGSTPVSAGPVQQGSASVDTTPYAVDIVDLGANVNTGFVFPGAASPFYSGAGSPTAPDGSGDSVKLGCHWLSTYNGNTVANVPGVGQPPYSSSYQWTSNYLNGQIAALMNLLNFPPVLRVQSNASTNVPASTPQKVTLPAATYDTYGAWSSGSSTYTVPLTGLYLIYGCTPYASGWGGVSKTGISLNGSNIWGPFAPATMSQACGSQKIGVFGLQAGTTVSLMAFQNSNSTQMTENLAPYQSLLVICYLGPGQSPFSPAPTAIDTTYQYAAGMSGSATLAALNAHMANDLAFLAQRPYVLTFSQNPNLSISPGTPTPVVMDHFTDPWGGWTGAYTAPVSGWYMAVFEYAIQALGGSSGGVLQAQVSLGSHGTVAVDTYQQVLIPDTTNSGYGCAGLGYYYMRAGESMLPEVNLTSGPPNYNTAGSGACHFELVWMSN